MLTRIATPGDFKGYKRLYESTVYSFDVGKPTSFSFDRASLMEVLGQQKLTQEEFDGFLNRYIIYLLIDDNEIIGYANLSFVSERAIKIDEFYIKRSLQFTGKGNFFYTELEKFAKSMKMNQISMFCPFPGAIRFWNKQGFSKYQRNPFLLRKHL